MDGSGLFPGLEHAERLHRQAAGIRLRFEHQRRDRSDQHSLGDAVGAMAADVAGDFAAPSGMAHVDRFLQVERPDQCREIVGVRIHFVAVPGLAGAAVAAAVMRDAAVPAAGQKQHLIFPGVRAERPAVTENDGLPCAPILVINLGAVLHCDCGHEMFSFFLNLLLQRITRNGPMTDRERFKVEHPSPRVSLRWRRNLRPGSVFCNRRRGRGETNAQPIAGGRRLVFERVGKPAQQANAMASDANLIERTYRRQIR